MIRGQGSSGAPSAAVGNSVPVSVRSASPGNSIPRRTPVAWAGVVKPSPMGVAASTEIHNAQLGTSERIPDDWEQDA